MDKKLNFGFRIYQILLYIVAGVLFFNAAANLLLNGLVPALVAFVFFLIVLGIAIYVSKVLRLTVRDQVLRSAVELAQLWRNDKMVRKLEAMMIVADADTLLIVSGQGDVIEPESGVCAIGSGGNYALAAARALRENTSLSAEEIARKALEIAGQLCVFTNDHITVETV